MKKLIDAANKALATATKNAEKAAAKLAKADKADTEKFAEARKADRTAKQDLAKADRAVRTAERNEKNRVRTEKLEAEKAERKANRKPTRAATFKAIVTETTETGVAVQRNKKEIVAEMLKQYGGSENEANFQVDNMIRLFLEFGFLEQLADKKLKLVQQPKS